MSKETDWPSEEPVPKSLEEARELGWRPSWHVSLDVEPCFSSGERGLPTCNVLLEKKIGLVTLYVEIQATVQFSDQFQILNPYAYEHERDKPKAKRLFDVHFVPPKNKVVRVLADDEPDAHDWAHDLFCGRWCLLAKRPDARRRPVFEYGKRVEWVATNKRPPQRRTRSIS